MVRIGLNFAPPSLTQEAYCCAFSVLSPKSGARLKTTVQLVASVGSCVISESAVTYRVNAAEYMHFNLTTVSVLLLFFFCFIFKQEGSFMVFDQACHVFYSHFSNILLTLVLISIANLDYCYES